MATLPFREALHRGYIARPEQLVENEEVLLRQGNGRTLCCQQIALPCGLAATVRWDRCMDIGRLSYRGVPIAWLGGNADRADVSPTFEQRFSGGMLYTCGLLNVGPGDGDQPTHGRIHMQSSSLRGVTLTDEALILRGEMRESSLFGENLLLRRTLAFSLERAEVRIRDTIENQSPRAQPYMLLYHVNLGYPFLSEQTKLRLPAGTQTAPATEYARTHLAELAACAAPEADFTGQDFHHRLPAPDGYCRLSAENEALGMRFSLAYRADTLPLLVQWRCLRSGTYVMGLEPSNNRVTGRTQATAEGGLPVLEPFGTVDTDVTLSLSNR